MKNEFAARLLTISNFNKFIDLFNFMQPCFALYFYLFNYFISLSNCNRFQPFRWITWTKLKSNRLNARQVINAKLPPQLKAQLCSSRESAQESDDHERVRVRVWVAIATCAARALSNSFFFLRRDLCEIRLSRLSFVVQVLCFLYLSLSSVFVM